MSKKIRIRSLGRIISDLSEFGLYGVAGMSIGGSLNVFWSTGIDATSTLEWGIDDSNPNTFTAVTESGIRKYHQIKFPTTFVDTYHYFRVRSTNLATGEEKVSVVYRIYITADFVIEARMGFQPVILEKQNMDGSFTIVQSFNYQTNPTVKGMDAISTDLSADGSAEAQALDLDESPETQTAMTTNITITIN